MPAGADAHVPVIPVEHLAAQRGALARRFYGDPSAHLDCIGVTGTNGKTSIAYHVADLYELVGGGRRCGYSGTLGWGFLDRLADADLTTTNAVEVQRRLALMLDEGAAHAALEVSSHALDQRRVDAVAFKQAIFSNLTRDHLDYHGTMDEYAAAKKRLFTEFPLERAIVSIATPFGEELASACQAPVVTIGPGGDVSWRSERTDEGLCVEWSTPWGSCSAELAVAADFAVANISAAMAAVMGDGIDPADVERALPRLRSVPGRLQVIGSPTATRPTVVVDYAHTPDALEHVLRALRSFSLGSLICVVGCGGDRDKGKRPMMAAAAVGLSDAVWLTSDNPRSEDAEAIIADMRRGLGGRSAFDCVDRREAICRALHAAKPRDVVLIAGKGHEDYQEIKGTKYPFSDARVAEQILEGL
jgi:UDP-N-acetylmuramoyl-L-alanyl-D-glutamate--2,6-diaminopimelate ligase